MKRIEDIEKMTAEELEAVANDARLPEGKAGAREVIAKLEIAEEAKGRSPRKVYIGWISGIAATFIVMLGIGLALQSRGPKDTFDDPVLAYAQVQSVLQQISSGMQQGKAAVDESGQMIADEFEKTIIKIK
ncbi:MAG: hypothetical protein J6U34_00280 [Bacteroidales bacterium]|nr:hypothetical protein [Bacteroidales bacterium]MBO7584969.1 hypothetical protein [Bacteroidales bacterium]